MKKILLLVLILLLVTQPLVYAQPQYVDMTPLREITDPLLGILKDIGAVEVPATVSCDTNYRKDWQPGTWMVVTGAFFFTDPYGRGGVKFTTYNPPPALEGFRPRAVAENAAPDVDGTIPQWDKQYYYRYQQYLTRPCVELSDLLRNPHVEKIWLWLAAKAGGASKFKAIFEFMGFSHTGTLWDNLPEDSLETVINQAPRFTQEYFPYREDLKSLPPSSDVMHTPRDKVQVFVPILGLLFFVFLIGAVSRMKRKSAVRPRVRQ